MRHRSPFWLLVLPLACLFLAAASGRWGVWSFFVDPLPNVFFVPLVHYARLVGGYSVVSVLVFSELLSVLLVDVVVAALVSWFGARFSLRRLDAFLLAVLFALVLHLVAYTSYVIF